MWRERINQEKNTLNITYKTMSERILGRIPERTISRILTGETENPRIDTIIELGEAVGLTPKELFADTNVVAAPETLVATSEKLVATTETIVEVKNALEEVKEAAIASDAEMLIAANEIEQLKIKLAACDNQIELLKVQIRQKDEIIKLISNIANLNIG